MYFEELRYYKSLISNPVELIDFTLHHDLQRDQAAQMAVIDMSEALGLRTIPNERSCHIPPFRYDEPVWFITGETVHTGAVDCIANTMAPPPNVYVYIKTTEPNKRAETRIIPVADVFRSETDANAELTRRLAK